MAFTESDLTAVENAIIEIATKGTAEVQIRDRRVRYTSLNQLYKLKELIQSDINAEEYGGSTPIEFQEVDD